MVLSQGKWLVLNRPGMTIPRLAFPIGYTLSYSSPLLSGSFQLSDVHNGVVSCRQRISTWSSLKQGLLLLPVQYPHHRLAEALEFRVANQKFGK